MPGGRLRRLTDGAEFRGALVEALCAGALVAVVALYLWAGGLVSRESEQQRHFAEAKLALLTAADAQRRYLSQNGAFADDVEDLQALDSELRSASRYQPDCADACSRWDLKVYRGGADETWVSARVYTPNGIVFLSVRINADGSTEWPCFAMDADDSEAAGCENRLWRQV